MGTLLKYLFYIFLLIVIYLLVVGFYEGRINKDTTVGTMTQDIAQGTKQIVSDGYEATKDAIKDVAEDK